MNIILNNKQIPRLIIRLAIFIATLNTATSAMADSRQSATEAVSRLRQTTAAQKSPEDMKSIDDAYAMAEQHHRNGDNDSAERYYLLTIQKAQVLETAIPQKTATPVEAPSPFPQTSSGKPPKPAKVSNSVIEEPEPLPDTTVSEKLVGISGSYTTVKGDSLKLVAAKLGVSKQHLIKLNGLDANGTIKTGQELKYDNRKIIPQVMNEGIVINIPDRTLYFFREGKLVTSLPVALGVPTKNAKYVWQTPVGKFSIVTKQKDPTWYVPPSIQSEMKDQGRKVITSIPPGPSNPLGKYAMKTSLPGILIHSTTKPTSIYTFASHGCIRVYPTRMEEFFKEVKVNTPGEIIYKPVKLAVTEEGRIILEVHNDIYSKSSGLASEAKKLIEKNNVSNRVDWKKVDVVVKQKAGVAVDVTL